MKSLKKYWFLALSCCVLIVGTLVLFALLSPKNNNDDSSINNSEDTSSEARLTDEQIRAQQEQEKQNKKLDASNLPKIIKANYIDISKIGSISKFRSDAGHDFSDGTTVCASMKHYFDYPEGSRLWINGVDIPPAPTAENGEPIYAPIDGQITRIEEEMYPLGKQIYIQAKENDLLHVRLFHIYPLETVKIGTEVTAGQQIGLINKGQGSDIAIEAYTEGRRYYSIFEMMTPEVFAQYQARGIVNREEFILSEEYRLANPVVCNGQTFVRDENYDPQKEWLVF